MRSPVRAAKRGEASPVARALIEALSHRYANPQRGMSGSGYTAQVDYVRVSTLQP